MVLFESVLLTFIYIIVIVYNYFLPPKIVFVICYDLPLNGGVNVQRYLKF